MLNDQMRETRAAQRAQRRYGGLPADTEPPITDHPLEGEPFDFASGGPAMQSSPRRRGVASTSARASLGS
eukprot:8708445-Alexandrium_andersonii.AAC.1